MRIGFIEQNGQIRELLPEGIKFADIAKWYNEEFASRCIEIPKNMQVNDYYIFETGTFVHYDEYMNQNNKSNFETTISSVMEEI